MDMNEITYFNGTPYVILSTPCVTLSTPCVTLSTPCVTLSTPRVILSEAEGSRAVGPGVAA